MAVDKYRSACCEKGKNLHRLMKFWKDPRYGLLGTTQRGT